MKFKSFVLIAASALKIDDLCSWLNLEEQTTSLPTTTVRFPLSGFMTRIREGEDLSEVTRPDSRRSTQAPATLKPGFVRVQDADDERDRPQQDSNRKYELCDLELRQSQRQRFVYQERWANCSSAYSESVRDQELTVAKLDDCTAKLQEGETKNQAAFQRVSENEAECKRSLGDFEQMNQELKSTNDKHLREAAACQASLKVTQKLKSHAEGDLEVCLEKNDETDRQLGICKADKAEAQGLASEAAQCRKEKAELRDRLTSEGEDCRQEKDSIENRLSSKVAESHRDKEVLRRKLGICEADKAEAQGLASEAAQCRKEKADLSDRLTMDVENCRQENANFENRLNSQIADSRKQKDDLGNRLTNCLDDVTNLTSQNSAITREKDTALKQLSSCRSSLVDAARSKSALESAGETNLDNLEKLADKHDICIDESRRLQAKVTKLNENLAVCEEQKSEMQDTLVQAEALLNKTEADKTVEATTSATTSTVESDQCKANLKLAKEEKEELTLIAKSCNGHLSSCKAERSALQLTVNMTRPCLSDKAQLQSRLNVCKDNLEESNNKLSKTDRELDFHKQQGFDMKYVNATTELQRCYKALNDALGSPVENRRLQENMGLANMPELNNFISLSQKSSACSGNNARPNPPMWLNPAHLWTAIGLLVLSCLGLAGVLVWKEFISPSPAQDNAQPAEPVGPAQPLLPAVQARPQPVQARPATQAQPQEVVSAGKDQFEIHV